WVRLRWFGVHHGPAQVALRESQALRLRRHSGLPDRRLLLRVGWKYPAHGPALQRRLAKGDSDEPRSRWDSTAELQPLSGRDIALRCPRPVLAFKASAAARKARANNRTRGG